MAWSLTKSWNLAARRKKLDYSLRSPFELMVNRPTYTSWLAFLNTYRTMCIAPNLEFHGALEQIRIMKLAA